MNIRARMNIKARLISAFTRQTKQDATKLYYGIIALGGACLYYAYTCFLVSSFFSVTVYLVGTAVGLFLFYTRILRPAYVTSIIYITNGPDGEDSGGPNEKNTPEEEFISSIKYINDKDRNDPENIKRRAIHRRATVYFYEGETTARKAYESAINAPKIKIGIGCFILLICAVRYYSVSYFRPEWCVLVAIVVGGYVLYQFAEYQRNLIIQNKAHSLSLEWRQAFNRRTSNERIYNTKGWADKQQTDSTFHARSGVYIGGNYYWNGQGHLLTIGSSRAGKGVNLIIPCLLSDGFLDSGTSFICLDPKGENAAITAQYVASKWYDVHVLNPFSIAGLPNSTFNPFSHISKDDDNVVEYCDMLSEMIVPMKANNDSNSEHFDTQARLILSAYMLYLVATEEKESMNFTTLFRWANFSGKKLDDLLGGMIESDVYRGVVSSIISGFDETRLSGGEKEASGILSTIRKGLSPFKNFKIQDSTARSSFDFRELAKRKMGIYVCLPQSEMDNYAVWLRIVIGCAIKLMQRHYDKQRKVLFIMDEFATLGYMRDFEKSAGYMAGFNVSFWVILQLLPQIQHLYPNIWETFIGNATVKHFLGIGDHTTAKYVSDIMPEIVVMDDQGEVVKEKKLLEPAEVISFPNIIVKYGSHDQPFNLAKLPYYETDYMAKRAGIV